MQYPELVSERARATFVRAFETKSVEFKPCLVPPKKKQANSSSAPKPRPRPIVVRASRMAEPQPGPAQEQQDPDEESTAPPAAGATATNISHDADDTSTVRPARRQPAKRQRFSQTAVDQMTTQIERDGRAFSTDLGWVMESAANYACVRCVRAPSCWSLT